MELTATSAVCDRAECPAPAAEEMLIFGQDFRFCRHHAVEVEAVLRQEPVAAGTGRPAAPRRNVNLVLAPA